MKLLVDAQLPRRLARSLTAMGHDAIHTLDLPRGNETPDDELLAICAREDRVLVSKDLEFADSFLLNRRPSRLLLVTTGNIRNADIEELIREYLPRITETLGTPALVELDRSGMTVHV
ncbi:MAG: DUF5615 family PIN-like protein [Spartobacteria bacterium]